MTNHRLSSLSRRSSTEKARDPIDYRGLLNIRQGKGVKCFLRWHGFRLCLELRDTAKDWTTN